MSARTDASLEANYALAGALAAIEGRLTQMVDSIRGQVINGVLFAGTVLLDGNGMFTLDFEVPFGSVAIGNNSSATVGFQNEGPQTSAPSSGVGVFTVGAGRDATIPIAGRALTLYGPAGGSVQLSVYDRPLGAAALGPVSSAPTANDGDGQANLVGGSQSESHNYLYNGATWDRARGVAGSSNVEQVPGMPLASGGTGAAAAAVAVTLVAGAGRRPYLAGLVASCAPPAVAVSGTVTVTGLAGGATLTYAFVETTAAGGLLNLQFPTPLAGDVAGTITVTVSAIATGNAVNLAAHGHQA